MFYFFSKTITYLLTPAGWLFLILAWAVLTKHTRRRYQLTGLALSLFWILGNQFLVNELALWWEHPSQSVPPPSSIPVAVVLTGGMINANRELAGARRHPTDRYILGREADRAGQALYLYKKGVVQKILISGGVGNLPFHAKPVSDEGQMTAEFLRTAGVRPDDILLENKSLNTHENAVFSARVLRRTFRTNQCILITSAWHMRRAIACFQKEGIAVVPFPTGFLSGERSFAPGEWLLPREEAFFNSYYFVRELIGYTTYKVVGYS